jgi:methylated-DNA-protein-cysteine methyltransferase-like protein
MRSITGIVLGPIGKSLDGIPVCFSHDWENDIVARQMTRSAVDKKPMVPAMTAAIRQVPRGRVSTYGAIAKAAGYPRCARHVARVLRLVGGLPWQRILGSGGRISLRGESAMEQRFRLEAEGVRFRGKSVNMKEFEHKFPAPGRKPAKSPAKRRQLPRK